MIGQDGDEQIGPTPCRQLVIYQAETEIALSLGIERRSQLG